MQLDVEIEPTLRFPLMTSIDKQKDKSEMLFPCTRWYSMYPYQQASQREIPRVKWNLRGGGHGCL